MATIRLNLLPEQERDCVASAAAWLTAGYAGVDAVLEDVVVTITAARRSERDLHRLWKTALLNEQIVRRSEARRRAMLEQLVS